MTNDIPCWEQLKEQGCIESQKLI